MPGESFETGESGAERFACGKNLAASKTELESMCQIKFLGKSSSNNAIHMFNI